MTKVFIPPHSKGMQSQKATKSKLQALKKKPKRTIVYVVLAIILALALGAPLIAGTNSYPLTIVTGTSMLPTLENGDVVYYTGIDMSKGTIPNGTIIVFTQDQTGPLAFLTRPVVIHRVIGTEFQEGQIVYITQGDNNDQTDSDYVTQDHILGKASYVVPKVGLFFDFIKSPQGLAVVISVIVIIYLVAYDSRWDKDKRKASLLSQMAQKMANDEFPEDIFRKFELVINYSNSMDPKNLKDPEYRSIAEWLKKGAVDHDWKIEILPCTNCGTPCVRLTNRKGRPLELCKKCMYPNTQNKSAANTAKAVL
ncbi:MAG TPA: signal peptidase I [Candidatus Acidoferrales bacterium]|nr:signal peptidase I [Candidatus Acidoferrales bacterium]